MAYRFRDVHDHLVRLADEAMFFQDRITSLLDAHLSTVSNQLNSVMKVLTVDRDGLHAADVLTGLYGMNVRPAALSRRRATAQFWWMLIGDAWSACSVAGCSAFFRRIRRLDLESRTA